MLSKNARDEIIKSELKEFAKFYNFPGAGGGFRGAVDKAVYWHIERRTRGNAEEMKQHQDYWDKIR